MDRVFILLAFIKSIFFLIYVWNKFISLFFYFVNVYENMV